MNRKQTLLINLIAGPCSGKSTISAELFSRLKKMNIYCELVPEYIKERIYEENNTITSDQYAIFGMEHYSILNKIGKVKVIVHDGSLINNIIYNPYESIEFNNFVLSEYHTFNNLDFFINRGNIEFETYGRLHNVKEANKLDNIIKSTYNKYNLPFIEVESKDAVDKIIPIILQKINELD